MPSCDLNKVTLGGVLSCKFAAHFLRTLWRAASTLELSRKPSLCLQIILSSVKLK